MAFGFPPRFIATLQLDDLTARQFLTLAAQAAAELGWRAGETGEGDFTAYTPFSMSSWSEKVTVTILGDYAEIISQCTGTQMVDWGKNKRNVTNFIHQFESLKRTTDKESLVRDTNEGMEMIGASAMYETSETSANTKKKEGILSLFLPRAGYFITPIIVDLNIAVYLLMVISGVNFFLPNNESLLAWGANFRPLTLDGQWWRLFTCCFLHIGIIHLVFNMYALLYIGLLLEPYLGKIKYAAAYFLTGIAASTTSLCLHELTISAGASGAIFGMYGVFLAMLLLTLLKKRPVPPCLPVLPFLWCITWHMALKAALIMQRTWAGLSAG